MSFEEVLFHLFQPSNTLFLLILAGVIAGLAGVRAGLWLALFGIICVAAVTVLPVGDQLRQFVEARAVAPPIETTPDGIIVLGGFLSPTLSHQTGMAALNENGDRLTGALALANQYKNATVIFTDGGPKDVAPGAEVAKNLAIAMGLDPARIVTEARSRSTWENAQFTRAVVAPREDQSFVLVTSALHMPRALATFRSAGWENVTPYPVDWTVDARAPWLRRGPFKVSDGLDALDAAAREIMALAVYRIRGITDTLLPRAHADTLPPGG